MQMQLLDFATDDSEAGFRLHRLEIYNWGTFDKYVWQIDSNGRNALLTGDIGSGKSTLVDALTTLLVPHHRIIYNKAAGAEGKERSLYSYIRGEYKTEKSELTQSAKAVALRDENNYSVLLAYFYNSGFDQGLTLAQVFWLKDQKRNPERLFVISPLSLTVKEHFSQFGNDIADLKKQLRQNPKIETFDNFKAYSTRFRQAFGIHNEQALDLFYQTVSMKSVGNLTEFVRRHMLEDGDVEQRIVELCHNFDNLNRAHEAVLKARVQIELLKPLVTECQHYDRHTVQQDEYTQCREAITHYFAQIQVGLLTQRVDHLVLEIAKNQQKLESIKMELKQNRDQESQLKMSIDDNGGRRLQAISEETARLETERERRLATAKQYHQLLEQLAMKKPRNEAEFIGNQQAIKQLLDEIEKSLNALQLKLVDCRVDIKALETQQQQLQAEIASLEKRQSNIPANVLAIRQALVNTLGVDEAIIPFVGELLQVDEKQIAWEGAIERVLHNFGLSLLVPEKYYSQVAHYVERTHLKGRIVYFRVKETESTAAVKTADSRAMVRKLHIKSDSTFYHWLEYELQERFDYICCDNLQDFQRLPKVIT